MKRRMIPPILLRMASEAVAGNYDGGGADDDDYHLALTVGYHDWRQLVRLYDQSLVLLK